MSYLDPYDENDRLEDRRNTWQAVVFTILFWTVLIGSCIAFVKCS